MRKHHFRCLALAALLTYPFSTFAQSLNSAPSHSPAITPYYSPTPNLVVPSPTATPEQLTFESLLKENQSTLNFDSRNRFELRVPKYVELSLFGFPLEQAKELLKIAAELQPSGEGVSSEPNINNTTEVSDEYQDSNSIDEKGKLLETSSGRRKEDPLSLPESALAYLTAVQTRQTTPITILEGEKYTIIKKDGDLSPTEGKVSLPIGLSLGSATAEVGKASQDTEKLEYLIVFSSNDKLIPPAPSPTATESATSTSTPQTTTTAIPSPTSTQPGRPTTAPTATRTGIAATATPSSTNAPTRTPIVTPTLQPTRSQTPTPTSSPSPSPSASPSAGPSATPSPSVNPACALTFNHECGPNYYSCWQHRDLGQGLSLEFHYFPHSDHRPSPGRCPSGKACVPIFSDKNNNGLIDHGLEYNLKCLSSEEMCSSEAFRKPLYHEVVLNRSIDDLTRISRRDTYSNPGNTNDDSIPSQFNHGDYFIASYHRYESYTALSFTADLPTSERFSVLYDATNFSEINRGKYCCNDSVNTPFTFKKKNNLSQALQEQIGRITLHPITWSHNEIDETFAKSHFKVMNRGSAPLSPDDNDPSKYNGNLINICGRECNSAIQNYSQNSYTIFAALTSPIQDAVRRTSHNQNISDNQIVYRYSYTCGRLSCDENARDASSTSWCGDNKNCDLNKKANYNIFPFIQNPDTAKYPSINNDTSASGSMCRYNEGLPQNGNRTPTIPLCDIKSEGNTYYFPWSAAVYEGSGNETYEEGNLVRKRFHCCKASCEGGPNQYQWFEKRYQGVFCDGSETKKGECYFENYLQPGELVEPACQSEEDSTLLSCPVPDYIPPTCNVNHPGGCTKCEKCEKPICPTCNKSTQILNMKSGECECTKSLINSCNRNGGVLNNSCECEQVQNSPSNLSTYGFSISAFNSGISEGSGGGGEGGTRPRLSDNFLELMNASKSSDLSDYGRDTPSDQDEEKAGYVFKACPIGHERSIDAPYSCEALIHTPCADGRISSASGDCTFSCMNPNNPAERSREFCQCITEKCCKAPQAFDPLLKICNCQERFLSKLENPPSCISGTTLNKNTCWCERNTGSKLVDWEKPECKVGTLDGRTCGCVSTPPPPTVYGLKRFSDFSCKHECNGNDETAKRICEANEGSFNLETCECNIEPKAVLSLSASSEFKSVITKDRFIGGQNGRIDFKASKTFLDKIGNKNVSLTAEVNTVRCSKPLAEFRLPNSGEMRLTASLPQVNTNYTIQFEVRVGASKEAELSIPFVPERPQRMGAGSKEESLRICRELQRF